MKSKAKFITLEGVDGAGKSTNLNFIQAYLTSKKIKHYLTREPGGTKLGEKLRGIVLHGVELNCCSMAELLILFAARAQHLEEIIYPKLAENYWVICDRFTDATFAYQGAGRGVDACLIKKLSTLVHNDFQPDLTLVLDVCLEIAKSRGANNDNDRFERQNDDFKHRVRQHYLNLSQSESKRVKLINANSSIDKVQSSIKAHLDRLISDETT